MFLRRDTTALPTSLRRDVRRHRFARPPVLAIAVVALAACQPAGDTSAAPGDAGFEGLAAAEKVRAEEGAASADQVAQLNEIAESGLMEFADVEEAVARTFACFDAAGVPHGSLSNAGSAEFPEVYYEFGDIPGLGVDESYAVADRCVQAESYFVERLYASSPGFVDTLATLFEPVRPAYITCLSERGVVVDESATYTELIDAGLQAQQDGQDVSSCLGMLP